MFKKRETITASRRFDKLSDKDTLFKPTVWLPLENLVFHPKHAKNFWNGNR